MFPTWRYHAFITNLEGDETTIDAYHRQHATVELAIRDLKQGAGLEHCPSGRFPANAAWLACAVLAHNTIRWCARLGDVHPKDQTLTVARTIRTRLLALPGRLVNRSGIPTLRLPTNWPWAQGLTQSQWVVSLWSVIRSATRLCWSRCPRAGTRSMPTVGSPA